MSEKNVSFFKGIFTVIVFSILIFVIIFFFFPNISMKYFSVAFDEKAAIEDTLALSLDNIEGLTGEEKEKFEAYLKSDEGKSLVNKIVETSSSGISNIQDFLSSDETEKYIENLKTTLSPETFEKVSGSVKDSISKLFR